jgi:hypothetical protein
MATIAVRMNCKTATMAINALSNPLNQVLSVNRK